MRALEETAGMQGHVAQTYRLDCVTRRMKISEENNDGALEGKGGGYVGRCFSFGTSDEREESEDKLLRR